MGCETVGQVGTSAGGQNPVEPLAAHEARTDMAIGFLGDLVNEVIEDGLPLIARDHVEGQGEERRSFAPRCRIGRGLLEVLLVEART